MGRCSFVKLSDRCKERDEPIERSAEQNEVFILCRSRDRKAKDEANVNRAATKIRERLEAMQARCEKQNRGVQKVEREIGRLLGRNTPASHLFEIQVEKNEQAFAAVVR